MWEYMSSVYVSLKQHTDWLNSDTIFQKHSKTETKFIYYFSQEKKITYLCLHSMAHT